MNFNIGQLDKNAMIRIRKWLISSTYRRSEGVLKSGACDLSGFDAFAFKINGEIAVSLRSRVSDIFATFSGHSFKFFHDCASAIKTHSLANKQ